MDATGAQKHVINVELNVEYEEIMKEVNLTVESGFNKILGPYKKLHISNIPYGFKKSDIIKMFQPFGPVFSLEVYYKVEGINGFGYITMYKADAKAAHQAFNQSKIKSMHLQGNKLPTQQSTSVRRQTMPSAYPSYRHG